MLVTYYFLIACGASMIGAISGIGGGIIIKPILDALGNFSYATINFLSACTVLSMSCISVLRNRKSLKTINFKHSLYLAISASLGGIMGKIGFDIIQQISPNEKAVGFVQSCLLLLINLLVLVYVLFQKKN